MEEPGGDYRGARGSRRRSEQAWPSLHLACQKSCLLGSRKLQHQEELAITSEVTDFELKITSEGNFLSTGREDESQGRKRGWQQHTQAMWVTWRSAYERSSAPAQAEAGATGPGYVAKIEEKLLVYRWHVVDLPCSSQARHPRGNAKESWGGRNLPVRHCHGV